MEEPEKQKTTLESKVKSTESRAESTEFLEASAKEATNTKLNEEVAKTHRLEGEFKDLSIKYSQKEVELDEVSKTTQNLSEQVNELVAEWKNFEQAPEPIATLFASE